MLKVPTNAHSSSKLSRSQRIVACLLLVMVIAFLVVNPLWESHDHMDNLRHLGPNGILVMFLLFACAGITLFKSLRWRLPGGSRLLPLNLKLLANHRQYARCRLLSIFTSDLLQPLRI